MTDFDKANPPIIMETDTAPPDSSVNDSDLNDSGVNDSGVNDSGLNDSGMNLMMYTTGHPAHLSNISIIMPWKTVGNYSFLGLSWTLYLLLLNSAFKLFF